MKIRVDLAKCTGHSRCAMVAPELFVLDDDGFNAADGTEVPESERRVAERGQRSCPERAITLEE
jgi:ferredoxin